MTGMILTHFCVTLAEKLTERKWTLFDGCTQKNNLPRSSFLIFEKEIEKHTSVEAGEHFMHITHDESTDTTPFF